VYQNRNCLHVGNRRKNSGSVRNIMRGEELAKRWRQSRSSAAKATTTPTSKENRNKKKRERREEPAVNERERTVSPPGAWAQESQVNNVC
jgi:hypothetical protein